MPSSAWSSDVCSSDRSEEHTSELQSPDHLVCRLLLEKKKTARQSEESTALDEKRCNHWRGRQAPSSLGRCRHDRPLTLPRRKMRDAYARRIDQDRGLC